MFYIREKYGNEGYAIWFLILEELGKADFHYLNLKDQIELMYLSGQLKTTETRLLDIISDLAKLKAIDPFLWESRRIIFSEKFIESISDAYERRNNNCITLSGLCEHLSIKYQHKPGKCSESGYNKPQSKVKYSIEKDTIYSFEKFWNDYGKKKEKFKSSKLYSRIPEKERIKIKEHVPQYVLSTPEIKFRKNPLTYLNGKCWEDEIEVNAGTEREQAERERIKRNNRDAEKAMNIPPEDLLKPEEFNLLTDFKKIQQQPTEEDI